jgi:hypothetical protein
MLTDEESALVADLRSIGANRTADLICQRGLLQLLRDMGLSDLIKEPTTPTRVDGEE